MAKVLKTFAAEFKIAAVKIGVVDKSVLSTAEVESLADLPSREVLLAQFLGVLLAPATKLARILNEPAASLARLLNAKAEKEGGGLQRGRGAQPKRTNFCRAGASPENRGNRSGCPTTKNNNTVRADGYRL